MGKNSNRHNTHRNEQLPGKNRAESIVFEFWLLINIAISLTL